MVIRLLVFLHLMYSLIKYYLLIQCLSNMFLFIIIQTKCFCNPLLSLRISSRFLKYENLFYYLNKTDICFSRFKNWYFWYCLPSKEKEIIHILWFSWVIDSLCNTCLLFLCFSRDLLIFNHYLWVLKWSIYQNLK